ncbi:MAG: exodeoxyribonuclease V subunit gamma [Clostridiales Family XIII bacterium]|jgi:ATP-dependent helicase/nuclease subunit B|nr:exodeoxyribonuclease V subunit gamma [Clostridiales Family XIII bacterium]
MLTIHYSREHIDKDRFLYERIAVTLSHISTSRLKRLSGRSSATGGLPTRVLLIVPEQFTLQAERNAFEYTDAEGFIDLDILSMSSLVRRIFAERGGGATPFLDQYGKFMLLSRLIYRSRNDLLSFRNLERSEAFINRMSDVIADLKNSCVSPETLKTITESLGDPSLLKRKLTDVSAVYAAYEDAVSGKFLDMPDRLHMAVDRIEASALIASSEIWFSGFDSFSPAMLEAVNALIRKSISVNIVLTAEPVNPFFSLTNALIEKLQADAHQGGYECGLSAIPETYIHQKPDPMLKIEQELFSYGRRAEEKKTEKTEPSPFVSDSPRPPLRLVAAANYYAEAETAAAQIAEMLREEDLRYRDILVLCNDMDARASVIHRVFSEYGLPVFIDKRRDISQNPVLRFILALPEIAANGRKYEDVFALLKTGLTPIPRADWEELENYVIKYKISGKKWRSEFTLGKSGQAAYDDEEFARLNASRILVNDLLGSFEESFKREKTAKGRTEALLRFLNKEANISEAAEALAAGLEAEGRLENALEVAGIPRVCEDILLQLIEVLGDLPMSMEEYAIVLHAGFSQVRIGILPPAMDQIVVGTMQRTRTGKTKVLFVLGANDGVLPAENADDGVLNEDEKRLLSDRGHDIVRSADFMRAEEQLAIYRNLCKPQQFLYMSYAVSDGDGKELRPSLIFERVRRLFPEVPVEKDILSAADLYTDSDKARTLIQAKEETLHHLTDNLRRWISGEFMPAVWADVWRWFVKYDPERLAGIRAGLNFRNRNDHVEKESIEKLYASADIVQTSPSALERFSRCPFSWFLGSGIRLGERRIHEIDSRSIGDLAHLALMRYGMEMCEDAVSVSDPASQWQLLDEAACRDKAGRIFDETLSGFQEGLLEGGGYERYKSERIRHIVSDAAWALTMQTKAGGIDSMLFETSFEPGGVFPPIESTINGKNFQVRGRIDRVDVYPGGYARIIDYKTGAESFSAADVLNGWQLQLMIYLKAASESFKPAGIFYFKLAEPRINDNGKTDVAEAAADAFNLDGVYLNDPALVALLGASGKGKSAIEPADFAALRQSADILIEDLLTRIADGEIAARPMTARHLKTADGKNKTACTYCRYRGICNYDKIFE